MTLTGCVCTAVNLNISMEDKKDGKEGPSASDAKGQKDLLDSDGIDSA